VNLRGVDLIGNWNDAEIRELRKIFSALPRKFIEGNLNLKMISREPKLLDAPPEAPGHSKYVPETGTIVVYDKGVYHGDRIDSEQFRRSVTHELAHSIVRGEPHLLEMWTRTTAGEGFVDDYAKTSPEEDFADTFSEYCIDADKTERAVPLKAKFVRHLFTSALFQ
jgi:hypothetical protein